MAEEVTRTERLENLLKRLAPEAVKHRDENGGAWPHRDGDLRATAPYTLEVLGAKRRVKIFDDDGGVVAGTGATVEEALMALEAKLA